MRRLASRDVTCHPCRYHACADRVSYEFSCESRKKPWVPQMTTLDWQPTVDGRSPCGFVHVCMYAHRPLVLMCPRVFTAVFQSSAQSFDSVCEPSVSALFPSDARKPQTVDGDRAAVATIASDSRNLSATSLNMPAHRATGTRTAGAPGVVRRPAGVFKAVVQFRNEHIFDVFLFSDIRSLETKVGRRTDGLNITQTEPTWLNTSR